jgi:hypothetical protein
MATIDRETKRRRIRDLLDGGLLPRVPAPRRAADVTSTRGQCVVCQAEGSVIRPSTLCVDCYAIFLQETAR